MSFSFGFCCHLSNREMTEIASLLSLLKVCYFRVGRREIHIWSPNPREGFSCNSFFSLLLGIPPLVVCPCSMWFGGPRYLRKSGFFFGKSCLVV